MRTRSAALVLAAAVVASWPCAAGRAEGEAREGPAGAASLRALLDAWDRRKPGEFADTIPVERAVLDAADAGRADDLLAAAAHERFGTLAFGVLCEGSAPVPVEKALARFRALPVERRVESARALAALGTEPVRSALRELAADEDVAGEPPAAAAVHAALLRAGDPAVLAATRAALGSKEPATAARALLLCGDARAAREFLAEAARLADDRRALDPPLESQWPERVTESAPDGMVRTTERPRALRTVGEAALEAASRMCATTLPDWVAWWREPERGPRFPQDAQGAKLVRAFVAADAAAGRAKALGACRAVGALVRALRGDGEPHVFRLTGIAFDGSFGVEFEWDGAARRATVSSEGSVAFR